MDEITIADMFGKRIRVLNNGVSTVADCADLFFGTEQPSDLRASIGGKDVPMDFPVAGGVTVFFRHGELGKKSAVSGAL